MRQKGNEASILAPVDDVEVQPGVSLAERVWRTLERVRVFDDGSVERKGRFNYLKWQAAWRLAKGAFPSLTCTFKLYDLPGGHGQSDVMYLAGGDANVHCVMTICEGGEVVTAEEIYPVLNNNNNPIKNPDAFATNRARQRARVKTLAYLGLGLHVYEGEEDDGDREIGVESAGAETPTEQATPAGAWDWLADIGVDIQKVSAFVTKERGVDLRDLSPGDIHTLKEHIEETLNTGDWK